MKRPSVLEMLKDEFSNRMWPIFLLASIFFIWLSAFISFFSVSENNPFLAASMGTAAVFGLAALVNAFSL